MVDAKLSREAFLIGDEKVNSLKNKKVLICGTGGVGSFVAEALARTGLGELTLVDFDNIDISNLNRQIMSNKNNIGKAKVEVLKKRLEIISDVKVITEQVFVDESYQLKDKYDYIADCMDNLSAKFHINMLGKKMGIKVISSMGAARRISSNGITYTTLDKTRNDPLARNFRLLCRKKGFDAHKVKVVYCDSVPLEQNSSDALGSFIFPVGTIGLKIAEVIFLSLINE